MIWKEERLKNTLSGHTENVNHASDDLSIKIETMMYVLKLWIGKIVF